MNKATALNGHGNLRRVERALLHPTGEHARFRIALAGGENK
jgi:hypothetical protein